MFLGEPGRTAYDLHFRLLGIAIRIHPGFWVVAALLGFGGGDNAPETILAFVAAVLISINWLTPLRWSPAEYAG